MNTIGQNPGQLQTQMLIDGAFVDSAAGKRFATINPATERPITDVAEGEGEDIDRAVRAARRALDNGPWQREGARERSRRLSFPRLDGRGELVKDGATLTATSEPDHGQEDLQRIVQA